MPSSPFRRLWICFLFSALATGQEYHVICQVQDYSGMAVSGATIMVQSPEAQTFTGISDSLGLVHIPFQYSTAVAEDAAASASGDRLSGHRYTLNSPKGEVVLYDILGRHLQKFDLEAGSHVLGLPAELASGKYFAIMETSCYRAVSSVLVIDGRVVGQGRTMVQRDQAVTREALGRRAPDGFTLSGHCAGYADFTTTFTLGEAYNSPDDVVVMNRLPQIVHTMADTLWSGIDLSLFVDDDAPGLWQCGTLGCTVSGDVLHAEDAAALDGQRLVLCYQDAYQSEFELTFQPTFTAVTPEKLALVAVVENIAMNNDYLELAFSYMRDPICNLLADLFEVQPSDMDGMTLSEIIDVFGEAWQMEAIRREAEGFYDRIITLNDDRATKQVFADSLQSLRDRGYIVDCLFDLHGSETGVQFFDGFWYITNMIQTLENRDALPRILYQTCCNGSGMIDEWQNAGIQAVSGAVGLNGMAIFSPIHFVHYWTRGFNFTEAVQAAYEGEIASLSAYDGVLPVSEILLGGDILEQSWQQVGGLYPIRFWMSR